MKVLITADIHISDYANYNFSYQSRLKQFSKLADKLVEVGKAENCEELWILGDLIDKPNSRPYILHEAQYFLYTICSHFKIVRYILGNHDLDTKSQSLSEHDSQITVFYFDNLIYMDKKLLTEGDKVYGFMNWRPEQDLEWLGNQHLDVLFGHYTKSTLFGQDIDESKFDLMIHGDIHNSQVIGKFVSVCNPIQKDMSSEAEGKVIIFDTVTAEWSRYVLDPDNTQFLQMHYTKNPEEEGFAHQYLYKIYKPDIISFEGEVHKAVDWSDITDLITKTCEANFVMHIHDQVMASSPIMGDIDFNFQVTELSIHGYRSIEDLKLDFRAGDRIALLGSNGSGKTSVIKALQGVFSKNSDLKWDQSDFTQDMLITVKLLYQGRLFEITKGSRWGLVIDGQEQGYSGIRDFEADLVVKLPFLKYLDLIFLNSSTSDLSTQLSSSRRIELINQFYRITQLESLHQVAMDMWKERNKELYDIQYQFDTKLSGMNTVVTRLDELADYEGKTKEPIMEKLNYYKEARVQRERYKTWKDKESDLNSKIKTREDEIKKIESTVTFNVDQAEKDVVELKEKYEKLKQSLSDAKSTRLEFESVLLEFNKVTSEGTSINSKLSELQSGVCPECKAPLVSGKLQELSSKYQSELDTLRNKWDELNSKISKYPEGKNSSIFYIKLIKELEDEEKRTFDSIELLQNKILNSKRYQGQLVEKQQQLADFKSELDELKKNEVEYIELPMELDQIEVNLISELSKIDEIASLTETKRKLEEELSVIQEAKCQAQVKCDDLSKYIELMTNTGVIVEEILKQLALKFSTPEIKYEVESGVYRGSRYINFNTFYLVKGTYRSYDQCSAGQKTVCDLDFLHKLFSTNMGLLVLDEYLKHLDDVNFSKVCGILSEMSVNTILLSTHDDNLTAYTKRLLLSLDETGRTRCSIG